MTNVARTHQMDDASGSQPDRDEDGDELGKPVEHISDEKLGPNWFYDTMGISP